MRPSKNTKTFLCAKKHLQDLFFESIVLSMQGLEKVWYHHHS